MKRITTLLTSLLAVCVPLYAQIPDLILYTENFEIYGSANLQTIVLGATEAGAVDVDCGFGAERYWIEKGEADQYGTAGTAIPCSVSSEGKITVTAVDNLQIDYMDLSGCGLTQLEIAHPEYVVVLNVEHNSLESLDLSDCVNAQALYLGDNPYGESPLRIGDNMPMLQILDINIVDNLDPGFSLTNYPALLTFDAMGNPSLTTCDPSQCEGLMKLSIDATNVKSLDVSHNPELLILNVSDTGIRDLDLSKNPKLRELYCDHMSGVYNVGVKLETLDLTNNPELIYLFAAGNDFESLDLSANNKLKDLYVRHNKLREIDLNHNPDLVNVMLSFNDMDFATLPSINPDWLNYEYQQNPLSLNRTYQVGEDIDLSAHLIRPGGAPTTGILYSIDENDPSTLVPIDANKYQVLDGVLTIMDAISDSVTCRFYNVEFPDCYLGTTIFKVKSATDFGQKDLSLSFSISTSEVGQDLSLNIGMYGAQAESPRRCYVDFGDGNLVEYAIESSELAVTANVHGIVKGNGTIKVFVDQDEQLTAFGLKDIELCDIDLSQARSLRQLSLQGTCLQGLDLQWNRCLEHLVLSGNRLQHLNLEGNNGGYSKNVLSYLSLANNEIAEIMLSPIEIIKYLDLSHNRLEQIDLTDGESIEELNLSFNNFETLKLNYQSALRNAKLSHNILSSLVLPETNVIEKLDIRDNRFSYANMPARNGMDDESYLYAPQAKIHIPSHGPVCDLSAQDVEIDGCGTQFIWCYADGTPVDTQLYSQSSGITTFSDQLIGHSLYCMLVNAAFPQFTGALALITTNIEVEGLPSYVVSEFDTPMAARATISLASHIEGNALYADWGDGTLQQYDLATTYQLYEVESQAGAHVRFLSYQVDNQVSVFSISGIKMKNADFTNLNSVSTFTLVNADLDEYAKLPKSSLVRELSLDGNRFETFDFSQYPALAFMSFDGNLFEELDLSGMSELQLASFANNQIENVVLDDNEALWGLSLSGNKLDAIDLSGAPNLEQIMLSYNGLSYLDVDDFVKLHVLMIDHNRFDFTSLPLPRDQWSLYVYGDQAKLPISCIDGIVDLSSQNQVNGVPTVYVWSTEEPYMDYEAGGLMVVPLIEGEDYVIEDGVTTFLHDEPFVCCVLYNEVFGASYLLSEGVSVTAALAPSISYDESVRLNYDLNGRQIVGTPRGIYISRDVKGKAALKIHR